MINPDHRAYLLWLKNHIKDDNHLKYNKLLNRLFLWPYDSMLPMDENRAADGVDMRYRYGYERKISDHEIANYIDVMQCTMLEMMVALVLRCEREIMYSQEYGDRSALLFWSMIDNLGLIDMDDLAYDQDYVDTVIRNFLDGDYQPDGKGSLFRVRNTHGRDLRNEELWVQANWYLDEFM